MDKPAWSDAATVEDIYYCYRILLMREPSQEDLDYWSERVAAEQLTYSRLAAYFRQSREFVTGRKVRGLELLTLDGNDLARLADFPRAGEGEEADVRADINECHSVLKMFF